MTMEEPDDDRRLDIEPTRSGRPITDELVDEAEEDVDVWWAPPLQPSNPSASTQNSAQPCAPGPGTKAEPIPK